MEILIVEDDSSTRSLLTQLLTTRGHHPVACVSAEQAMEAYRQSFFSLVLLDLFLPGLSGFEFCRWLRDQHDGDRPYVLVGTSSKEARDLRQILDAGADDYLAKPYGPDLLDVRLAVAEQALKTRAARRQAEEELHQERERLAYLATRDSLTKLHNRAHFSTAVEAAVAAAGPGNLNGALFYIDLDNFKIVNDSLGHAAGDRLLVQIAYLLRNAVRAHDTVARFGGDEFVILQEAVTLPEARLAAERLRGRVSDFVFCDSGKTFHIGVSVGVAAFNGQTHAEHVIAAADSACYAAKARGRNRVELAQGSEGELAQLRNDSAWATRIKQALKNNAFELWFQPVINLETEWVEFHEALIRLRTEEGEIVEPALFLPAAERFHMAGEIDRRVIKLALRHLAADPALHLAINLSGQSVSDISLPEFIRKSFAAASVLPGRATFEITETAVISNLAVARAMMAKLREEGFRFALDDFGAGFSSFSYLKNLAVDFLKIDGSFIRDLISEPINMAFVKVMNDIARHLRVRAVAEHVESAEALKALRGIGVHFAQGYHFSPPAPKPAWVKIEDYAVSGRSEHGAEAMASPAGVVESSLARPGGL